MLSIGTRKLVVLIFAIGILSWYSTATGFAQFAGAVGADGSSSLVTFFAVSASVLIQALMALFLTISLSVYIVHLRTRALYLLGYAIMTGISVVLAVAFWASFLSLPEDDAQAVLNNNRDITVKAAEASRGAVTRMFDSVAVLRVDTDRNIDSEAEVPRDRYHFWTWMKSGFDVALNYLVALKRDLEAGIAAAGSAATPDELQQVLGAPMDAVTATNVPAALKDLIGRAIDREKTLNQSIGHRQRWERILPQLQALEVALDAFDPAPMPTLQKSAFEGALGSSTYALMVVEKFFSDAPLTRQERIALSLAITVDLIFAILLILRAEGRRPDQEPDFVYHYTPMVEALNARLKRNGIENGISGVVDTLQSHGKGLLGLDRLFGLVVTVPDASSKSHLSQIIAFSKSDGTALDVSGLATLFSAMHSGSTAREREAMRAQNRRVLTVLIPPAQWRLMNRLKKVEDQMPTPEDKGTLAHFVQQQRRKKPRVYTAQKVNTLNKYFSSAMEASLDELVPARIERIVDAYKSDTRVKRLKRPTREKHEAIFREVIDAVRNEGLLPNHRLRIAS